MWLTILWNNRKIISEIVGLILVGILAWWFFIHNPKIIDGLEKDKAELSRQVDAGKQAIELLSNIQAGKERINAQTFKNISTIRATAIPKRAVIVHGGLLPTVPATNSSN